MNVIIVACHPDDETLGCGGTLLRHRSRGDKIHWIIATSIKEDCGFSRKAVAQREKEIKAVAAAYRFEKVYRLEMPTTRVGEVPAQERISRISAIFHAVRPNTVYLPFRADVHSDHRLVFDDAYGCTKIFRHPYIKNILMMEALSETEFAPSLEKTAFIPNYFVDIGPYITKKLDIMKIYKNELASHPFPRSLKSIRALATVRGGVAGCRHAEAFMALKQVVS